MNDAVVRLAERLYDLLADPKTSDRLIGRLGALAFDYDDDGVMAIRGESTRGIEDDEMLTLLRQGIESMNDPRIRTVTMDDFPSRKSGVVITLHSGTEMYATCNDEDGE